MERERIKHQASPLIILALVAQNLVISVMSTATVGDQKNYYTPDPHAGTPPTGSHHGSPSHGTPPSGGSYGSSTPPSHGTPSHGSGGSYGTPSHGSNGGGTPPSNCGNPPSGHYDPTPAPPTPTGGSGGGYYNSPPTSTPSPPTIITPPATVSPPTTPYIDPGSPIIPGISPPSPPFDPNSPPLGGTCDFWRSHPGLVWGLFGYWGTTVGGALGVTSAPGFGTNLSLQQALSNTRSDGFGALYREGTASLLNSMVNKNFPFTTNQVRDNFVSALGSNKAAAAQAKVFKLANEGRLKP